MNRVVGDSRGTSDLPCPVALPIDFSVSDEESVCHQEDSERAHEAAGDSALAAVDLRLNAPISHRHLVIVEVVDAAIDVILHFAMPATMSLRMPPRSR